MRAWWKEVRSRSGAGAEQERGARVTRVGQERGRIGAGEGAGLIIRPF